MGSEFHEGARKKPHVLVVTIAFPGHFGPFVQILYHLAARYEGLTVTVWGNEDRIEDLRKLQRKGGLKSLDLRLEVVFGPVPVYAVDPKSPVRSAIVSPNDLRECEPARRKLVEQKDMDGGPTVIIADAFEYWSKDLADELGAPWYTYYSVSSMYTVAIMQTSKMVKDGLLRANPSSRYPNDLLTSIPGLTFCRVQDLAEELYDFQGYFEKMTDRTRRATGILLNSSEELESACGGAEALRALADSARVLPIGPSLQFPGYGFSYAPTESTTNCLEWLNSQPACSVLYIAFGTLSSIAPELAMEVAAGVEASGVPFLWALQPKSRKLSDMLPNNFTERTEGRGLIETGFAPQSRILAHPAIRGFLSHMGWNSTLESIVAGVPLIGWPFSFDQPLNARFIADIWRVGFNICNAKAEHRDSFNDVGREEVEKTVRLLMLDEKAYSEVKINISKVKRSLEAAVAEGGSSHQNLNYILDEITSVRQNGAVGSSIESSTKLTTF